MSDIIKYGAKWPEEAFSDPVNIELYSFLTWRDSDKGGLGRFGHLKNAIKTIWPSMEFNPWFDMRMREFCDPGNWVINESQKFLNLNTVGCAASGKTHDWVVIGFTWWLADPLNSRFSFCSAQKQMISSRSWRVLQELYAAMGDRKAGLHMVNSKYTLQSQKSDAKHCVDILASAQGETDKAVQRLAGNHPKRYFICVDEASDTPEAIYAAVTNASKACEEFVFVTAGNAWSRMDPLGRCCTPVNGWNAVDRDTEVWKTAGVREWNIKPGVAIHFSGRRSPNVKRGKTYIPYLYTKENYLDAQGHEDTLAYWRQDEGFWAPDGLSNTVMDEALVLKMDGAGRFDWNSKVEAVAALDPAFGGDQITLKFGQIGDIDHTGRLGLQITEKEDIKIREGQSDSIELQITKQVMEACRRRGVKPECFGLDATGIGRGVASYLQDMWSPLIVKVEFGGAPTDAPVSQDDPTSRKIAYDRKVTELWFTVKEMLKAGQLKGLDPDSISQFCRRTYDYRGKKIILETKADCKKRINRSPDDADCIAVMCYVAEQRGMVIQAGGVSAAKRGNRWLDEARKFDELYDNEPSTENNGWMSWVD